MIHTTKIQINKYKSEYIIKLVGVYINKKSRSTVDNISTQMGNIHGENVRMNYINVNHLVRFYDVSIGYL